MSRLTKTFLLPRRVSRLVCGCATGVDSIAYSWAFLNKIDRKQYRAKWRNLDGTYNARAGLERNEHMLREENIDLVVAFPGGTGTRHMKEISRASGIPIMEFNYDH